MPVILLFEYARSMFLFLKYRAETWGGSVGRLVGESMKGNDQTKDRST